MAIKHWIERDKRRVRAVITGTISIEEIIDAINTSISDPDFEDGYDILSDHRKIERAITKDQIMMTTSHIKKLSQHLKGSRWAVVTEREASYGMMKMLSVYLEKIPLSLQVFKSIGEADTWLSK